MSIKQKLISGAIWNSISQFGSQAINFILIIILARLLNPGDFGLLGQVGVITGFLSYFTEFGIKPSLIQKENPTQTDCDTAYYGMFFFAITVYIIVFFLAPLIGAFYGNEKLVLIARVLFLQFLINPFIFVNTALETKNLVFKKMAFAELTGLLISGIIGITLAYNGFGVWSLVFQSILAALIRAIIILFTTTWRPGLSFSITCFFDYVRSGMHFTYRNITLYFSENTDFLIIGKLLGPSTLGIYTLAYKMSNYPFAKVQAIFGQMLFPAFTLYQGDKDKLRSIYLKLTVYGGVFLTPIAIAIYFGIFHIVSLLLGTKWIATVPIVKVLVIYLVFSSISFASDPVLISLHKIKTVNTIKTIIAFLLFSIGYLATSKYGVLGMAVVFTVFSTMYILIIKIFLMTVLKISIIEYLQNMKIPILLMAFYILIFELYSHIAFAASLSSMLFLIGEGFLFILIMICFLIWKGFINIKSRSIHFETL